MIIISSETNNNECDILDGVAFHKSGVVCYNNGLEEFKKHGGSCSELIQGRFFIKYCDGDNTIIRTDEDGKELVFYYSDGDFWCVSTSFLGMLWFLKEKGMHLTASKLELAKFFVNTSLFEQPYNHNLPIKEIKLLDAGSEINITKNSFEIKKIEARETFKSGRFFDLVSDFIKESRITIGGLVGNFDVDLELSGGVDSRIVLGLALPYKDKIKVSSDKSGKGREDDYIIAKAMSYNYNIELGDNKLKNYGSNDISSKWALYKLGCIGVSRTNPRPNSASGTKFSKRVRLNGGGGENSRVFYNSNIQAYFNVINKTNLADEVKSKLIIDLTSALDFYGYKSSPQKAMVDIYSAYRQRYFSGRAWYYSLLGLVYAPMAGKSFSSIMTASDIEDVFGCDINQILERNLILLFILNALDPMLPFIRFDNDKKNFPLSDIRMIQEISQDFKRHAGSNENNSNTYGEISDRVVLPCYLSELATYEKSDNDYMSMFDEDIAGVVDVLGGLNILSPEYLDTLKLGINNDSLDVKEKLPLLHIAEILKYSSNVCE
ncbi:asparagine synthase (glutamine-hydrolyzing) [Aeromonas dhakensis]|uniref:hypothetical protein n=1 Tax=Aeromonas dhakensis TaxID=196024 RepID=UPI002B491D46|nr:hypothetical protein [Aeromonas dhakensis]